MNSEITQKHQAEVDRLYELLERRAEVLRERYGHVPRPSDLLRERSRCQTGGVYFIFEPNEKRSSGVGQRVVRVGTTSSIESRLVKEHAKDWGRSRFRMQIGAALLRRGDYDMHIEHAACDQWVAEWYRQVPMKRGTWGVHDRPSELDPVLHSIHPLVSHAVSEMGFLWVEVADKETQRALERECIRLLSNHARPNSPIDPPSTDWLGRHARETEIRQAGLWNVMHVKKPHTPGFLDDFQGYFQ